MLKAPLVVLGVLLTLQCVELQRSAPPQQQSRPGPPPPPPSQQRPSGGEGKCALIIPTHGGESSCITVESINRAFAEASARLRQSSGPARNARGGQNLETEVDLLGRIIVETTRLLAEELKLPVDAIHAGLPLIDVRKTDIDRACPAIFKGSKCDVSRFRTPDGTCNNLENTHQAAALSAMRRLIPNDYADGVVVPRISVTGKALPSPRVVSAAVHRDLGFHDHAVTTMLPSWGQMIDHDIALGGDSRDPATNAEPRCCDVKPEARHPACFPVEVPRDDPFYSLFKVTCLNLARTATGLKEGCRLGARDALNLVSSYLDASQVYGSSPEVTRGLREMKGGLMRTNPIFRKAGLKDLLPPRTEDPDQNCVRPSKDRFCFLAGDLRVNQQMMLLSQHMLLLREHNRIATELSKINPHWDDERLFQETRHIIAAIEQHITYNEYLPMVLGKEIMERFDLLPLRDGYLKGYNPKLDVTIPAPFFVAAYRFGHSLIPSALERWSNTHKFISALRLSDNFNNPFEMYKEGAADQFFAGFLNQVAQAVDDAVTHELTNHLFREPKNNFGSDLASMNMQRGREHGVSGYNSYREFCGLKRAKTFRDLAGVFTNETLNRYEQLYEHVDDIDLWSAGISERPSPGSMVGPVFGCIMGETFRNMRFGDRFWYENGGMPSSFTPEQLNEIRKVKLSRIVCDNSDHIETVQVYAMVLPDHEINPRVPCKSSVLPRIDLSAWKE